MAAAITFWHSICSRFQIFLTSAKATSFRSVSPKYLDSSSIDSLSRTRVDPADGATILESVNCFI